MCGNKLYNHNIVNFKFFIFLFLFVFLVSSDTTDLDAKSEEKAEKSHQIDSLNILAYVSLLILTILTVWLFKHRRFRFVHETGLAVIYGLIVGAIIKYSISSTEKKFETVYLSYNSSDNQPPEFLKLEIFDKSNSSSYYQYAFDSQLDQSNLADKELQQKATFDPEIFFNVILPPIIFNAGYQMKRRHFFKNIGAIMAFAFLGTLISSFTIGGLMYGFCLLIKSTKIKLFTDCLLFGAIISATDPVTVLAIFNELNVDVDLYALVFGESILNDAVAIVLASSIESYKSASNGFDFYAFLNCIWYFTEVFFGSFFLGSGMGCITALLTKFTHLKNFPLLETSLFVLMSYATFLAAEAMRLTGIVAVLFCGICQAHYTYNNLSPSSQNSTKEVFALLNFLMENFVFTYIGVTTFTFQKHSWDVGLIFFAILVVIIGRACNVYPLSFLVNFGRSNKIPCRFQHVMMFSGLRGAMAFALAIRNTSTEARQTIFSITLIIVIVTVIICGGLSTQIMYWLKIRMGVNEEDIPSINNIANQNSPSGNEKAKAARIWSNLDRRFIKPLLTNFQPPLTETLPKCCLPIARLLTTTAQLTQQESPNGSGDIQGQINSASSDLDLLVLGDENIPENDLIPA